MFIKVFLKSEEKKIQVSDRPTYELLVKELVRSCVEGIKTAKIGYFDEDKQFKRITSDEDVNVCVEEFKLQKRDKNTDIIEIHVFTKFEKTEATNNEDQDSGFIKISSNVEPTISDDWLTIDFEELNDLETKPQGSVPHKTASQPTKDPSIPEEPTLEELLREKDKKKAALALASNAEGKDQKTKVQSNPPRDDSKTSSNEHAQQQQDVNAHPMDTHHFHMGVFCVKCNVEIIGIRYKSLVKSNYDLCQKCESTGIHPEPLAKIRKPIGYRKDSKIKSSSEQLTSLFRDETAPLAKRDETITQAYRPLNAMTLQGEMTDDTEYIKAVNTMHHLADSKNYAGNLTTGQVRVSSDSTISVLARIFPHDDIYVIKHFVELNQDMDEEQLIERFMDQHQT